MALQIGREKGAEVVVTAEAVEDQGRRNQHPAYRLVNNTKYMAVYIKKGNRITTTIHGDHIVIGSTLVAACPPPLYFFGG